MNRLRQLRAGLLLLALGIVAGAEEKSPPNIVIILIDDAGWSDFGCYGAKLAETPNLDRLATAGLRFTAAYAPAPICSASRASLLTGRSPARLHFEFVTKEPGSSAPARRALVPPPFPVDLPLTEVTLAELLGPAGYRTGYFGKWHLTQANDRYLGHGDKFGPRQQGFDESSEERGSHPYGYAAPKKTPPRDQPEGNYEVDRLSEQAAEFIRRHQRERFFLFYSPYHVHDPVDTRCGWLLEKYRTKAARLGLTGAAANDDHVRYAAFVEIMDHYVGRVLAALDETGVAGDTLVIVTSDNGGHPRFADNGGLRGSKWTLYEGGIRVPWLVRWPRVVAPGAVCASPVIGTDLLPTLAAVAGVPLPAREMDGVDLQPLLRDPAAAWSRRQLAWHFPFYHEPFVDETPVSAIRVGNLKLVHHYEGNRSELFDLESDPRESRDLSAARPAEAAALRRRLEEVLRAEQARLPELRRD